MVIDMIITIGQCYAYYSHYYYISLIMTITTLIFIIGIISTLITLSYCHYDVIMIMIAMISIIIVISLLFCIIIFITIPTRIIITDTISIEARLQHYSSSFEIRCIAYKIITYTNMCLYDYRVCIF